MKGSGRLQRAIVKLIDDGDADLYAPVELAKSIYQRPATSMKLRTVIRAVQSLVRRYPEKLGLAEGKSGDLLRVIRRD